MIIPDTNITITIYHSVLQLLPLSKYEKGHCISVICVSIHLLGVKLMFTNTEIKQNYTKSVSTIDVLALSH